MRRSGTPFTDCAGGNSWPRLAAAPGGREQSRPITGGAAAEHATKIYWIAGLSIVVIVAFLALTGTGHVIDAATQHFMLFYAGVFALIALCASVGLGLVATDRIFLSPGTGCSSSRHTGRLPSAP